jgi:hypothetical protein
MSDRDLSLEIRSFAAHRAREGYDSDAEILEAARESFRDEHPDLPALDELVDRLTLETLDEVTRAETTWPETTDCDRLDRAFTALEEAGVVARQHFTCCQNCGHAEIGDEIRASGGPEKVHGYTFFHTQTTEAAVQGSGLWLAYGAVLPGKPSDAHYAQAAVAVGHEVVRALAHEGLSSEWNGTAEKTIHVKLDWKRRRLR